MGKQGMGKRGTAVRTLGLALGPALGLALVVSGCGDDGDSGSSGSDDSGGSAAEGLDADADALVSCLGEADVEAAINENEAFGVEADHVGVEVTDLPSELMKYDSGSGTTTGVDLWVFEDDAAAEEWRTAITLSDEDDEARWVDGRVVVRWDYPVDREQPQAVAVDDCVTGLNG